MEAPNNIERRVPVIDTFRGKATAAMREGGLADWSVSFGRQRLGALARLAQPSAIYSESRSAAPSRHKIDLAALDIIRDREHGLPRFNEFRRQIGLRQLTGF